MKRIFTLSLLTMALFFTQCKKSEQAQDSSTPVIEAKVEATPENTLAVESVKSLPTQNLKRLAFSALKPIERYLLWIDNIKTVSAGFTPKQKQVAYELAAALKPSLFIEADATEATTLRDSWLPKAEAVFTPAEIRSLTYTIASITTVSVNSNNLQTNLLEQPKDPNCNCHGDAQFDCNESSYCFNDNLHGDCKNPTSGGCGFFWVYSCDHACYTPKIGSGQS